MKLVHLTLAAMFAATVISTASAEELENPVQGAVVRYFNCKLQSAFNPDANESMFLEQISLCLSGQMAAVETKVDVAEDFNTAMPSNRRLAIWDGCLKSVSGGVFTFTFSFDRGYAWNSAFSVWINGQQLTQGSRRAFSAGQSRAAYAFDVQLHPGFNNVRIATLARSSDPLAVTYKKEGSLQSPRHIGPGDLWREDELEEEEW